MSGKNFMEIARSYLDNIYITSKKIINREQEIEALYMQAGGLKGITYDGVKVQTSPMNYMEMALADAHEKEMENEEDKAKLEELKTNAYIIIRRMEDEQQRTILEYHYLNGLSITEIYCNKMYMSERKAYYLLEDALENFGKYM